MTRVRAARVLVSKFSFIHGLPRNGEGPILGASDTQLRARYRAGHSSDEYRLAIRKVRYAAAAVWKM